MKKATTGVCRHLQKDCSLLAEEALAAAAAETAHPHPHAAAEEGTPKALQHCDQHMSAVMRRYEVGAQSAEHLTVEAVVQRASVVERNMNG